MDIRNKFRITSSVAAALLVFASFGVGIAVGVARSSALGASPSIVNFSLGHQAPSDVDLNNLWTVWDMLNDRFVPTTASSTKASDQDKINGMIEGLAASYGDPYTVFLPPVEAKAFAETVGGSFGGVGMEVGIKNEQLIVVSPLKGSPAEKAGVMAGDNILEINGVSTQGFTVEIAVSKIRGEIGTKVKLMLHQASSSPRAVEITRDTIQVPVVETTSRPDGVFVISIYSFSAPSAAKFKEAMRKFIESGSNKLILDLRGNPGGYLESAVDIASYFLPLGEVVVTEDYSGKQTNEVHRSAGYNVLKASNRNAKVAVLINGGSASASEILAGALRDQDVATLIGERSFGKGSVQELINLDGGASLKITIARWLTPRGTSISEKGIVPDREIKMTIEDIKEKKDPQMQAAADFLNGK